MPGIFSIQDQRRTFIERSVYFLVQQKEDGNPYIILLTVCLLRTTYDLILYFTFYRLYYLKCITLSLKNCD